MVECLGKIVTRQGRDAPPEDAVQCRAGAVALVGLERMAGDAGAKHLRARVVGIDGERILDATACDGADRLACFGIPAPDHAIRAAGEQHSVVGKNATDQTGMPGPPRVRASVRVL
jgi:hypothetical protein